MVILHAHYRFLIYVGKLKERCACVRAHSRSQRTISTVESNRYTDAVALHVCAQVDAVHVRLKSQTQRRPSTCVLIGLVKGLRGHHRHHHRTHTDAWQCKYYTRVCLFCRCIRYLYKKDPSAGSLVRVRICLTIIWTLEQLYGWLCFPQPGEIIKHNRRRCHPQQNIHTTAPNTHTWRVRFTARGTQVSALC